MGVQTDNQQRKLIEMAWLAGFIDGEGSIGIKVQKYMRNKSVFYVAPYVQITNTNEPSLDKIISILKENKIGHYIDHPKPRKAPHGTKNTSAYLKQWRLLINGLKRCDAFLKIIMPYLVVKKPNAELVNEFIESRKASYYKHLPYTAREIEIINQYRRIPTKTRTLEVF